MIFPYKGCYPKIHPSVFLCPDVVIVGDVTLDENASVWFGAVIRGDVNYIRIGPRTNVQDNCTLHVMHDTHPLTIGADVTIGHGAVIHGCTIHDSCLVGMNATLLDGSVMETHSLVAAGSLLRMNAVAPEGMLAGGVPAKVLRALGSEERLLIAESAANYIRYSDAYRQYNDLPEGIDNDAFLHHTKNRHDSIS